MVALVCLMSLTLSSCASLTTRLSTASKAKGAIAAGIDIGRMPDDCYLSEAHAPLYVGAEARTVIKLERKATVRANGRVIRCVHYFEDLRTRLKGSE